VSLLLEPETHRIDLGDGEWVDVRRHMTSADRNALNSRAMTVVREQGLDGEMGPARATIDPGLWGQVLLERMIVAWSDQARVTPANIGRLPPEAADRIRAEIDCLNPGRSDVEKKDSTANSSPVTE
jgi:hypothetical protein